MNPYDQQASDPFGSGNQPPNPYGQAPHSQPASTSSMAIVSLLFGILSLPLAFICCLNIPTALIAIITGHVSSGQITRSRGTLTGKGMATAGFGLGYFSFVLMLIFPVVAVLTSDDTDTSTTSATGSPLRNVESAITTDDEGVAHGNTPEAVELAEAYSIMMDSMDELLFTQTDSSIKLSGGNYVTWCELHEGGCAFVVHVPEYRKFDDEAKEQLAKIAWDVAQTQAREVLEEGDDLAVGLRGIILYGSVQVGTVTSSEEDGAGLISESTDKEDLFPFFEDEETEDEWAGEEPFDTDILLDDEDQPADDVGAEVEVEAVTEDDPESAE